MKSALAAVISSSRRRGLTYLYQQDFEDTGAPDGWTWNGTGTCNFDQPGGDPSGSEYLRIASTTNAASGGAQFTFPSPFPLSTYGLYCRFFCGTFATNINRSFWMFNTWYFTMATGGPHTPYGVASGMVNNQFYHMWLDVTPTSGEWYLSTTGEKPITPKLSSVAAQVALSKVNFSFARSEGAGLDKLRVAAGPIGSYPL